MLQGLLYHCLNIHFDIDNSLVTNYFFKKRYQVWLFVWISETDTYSNWQLHLLLYTCSYTSYGLEKKQSNWNLIVTN